MLKFSPLQPAAAQRGFSLIEALITIIILAFGLLGLAGLQSRVQVSEVESYQRAQAIILLAEMSERLSANRANAAGYPITGSIGTGDTISTPCPTGPSAAADLCEWSSALKGSSETLAGAKVGGMIGARGCITQVQAPNPAQGFCTPGIYTIDVAWQGLQGTVAPSSNCGNGSYGANEAFRHVISSTVTVGLPTCS